MSPAFAIAAALAAQGGITTSTPPPPIVRLAPTAPPTPVLASPSARSSSGFYLGAEGPSSVLEMQIAAGSEVLWRDTLRVGGRTGANYQQSKAEADPPTCPIIGYERSTGSSLRVNVQPAGAKDGRAGFNLDVHWTRPTSVEGCSGEGTRSVSIRQMLELGDGEERVLRGDGGLTVRIRRR